MDPLRERRDLRRLLRGAPRSARQLNDLFESDTEILRRGPNDYLVSSVDSIAEEITLGLYQDPDTWGWMTVMSSVSDLAASGARPLGLLLSTQWAFGTNSDVHRRFQRAANRALRATSIPLLGGDSGGAKDHCLTSTILGESRVHPLTRIGVRPGDLILLAGPPRRTGAGPALAYRYLRRRPAKEFAESLFRPRPDWGWTAARRKLLVAGIDTSDGLAASLAIIARLNNVGFDLEWNLKTLHPQAMAFCRRHRIPLPMLWMGDHGDFQSLVFARPDALKKIAAPYSVIGTVTKPQAGFCLRAPDQSVALPLNDVVDCERNLVALKMLIRDLERFFHRHGFDP